MAGACTRRAANAAGGDHDNPFPPKKTVGWSPGCDCNADIAKPRIIDPFFGSGTVGLVGRKMGLETTGIELSEAYCRMAAKRLEARSLFA